MTQAHSTPPMVHDDARREFDDETGAEKALSAAQTHGWFAVSMQSDRRWIFPN